MHLGGWDSKRRLRAPTTEPYTVADQRGHLGTGSETYDGWIMDAV